jgi:hypothetical protein
MNRVCLWLAVPLIVIGAAPASADPDVAPDGNSFHAKLTKVRHGDAQPQAEEDHAVRVIDAEARPSCLQEKTPDCVPATDCVLDPRSTLGGYVMFASPGITYALGECTVVGPQPILRPLVEPRAGGVTAPQVLQAFRRIPLPESRLVVQPPGGRTLVNFDTLFHTEAEPFMRTVRLLGQRVQLEITPSAFTWHHGDGTSQTTHEPGLAYERGRPMSDYVSHQYVDAHVTVRPSVDTVWSARFRVNGGPWRDVEGTVTMRGAPASLRVVEARPVLVRE